MLLVAAVLILGMPLPLFYGGPAADALPAHGFAMPGPGAGPPGTGAGTRANADTATAEGAEHPGLAPVSAATFDQRSPLRDLSDSRPPGTARLAVLDGPWWRAAPPRSAAAPESSGECALPPGRAPPLTAVTLV